MALFHRERTGEGQKLHVPMYESFASFVVNEHLQGQTFVPPTGPSGYSRLLTTNRRPYQTKDGFISVVPYTQKHWENFFEVAGAPHLIDDERFKNQTLRTENIDALYQIVSDTILSKTSQEWRVILENVDIPAGPVNSPEDLFNCPHLKAVKMFPEVDHPTEGRIRHIRVPVTFSKTPGGLYQHAKVLGENTEQILSDLGLSNKEIENLYEAGAIGAPPEKLQ